jgi:hypothetical protein
MIAATAKKVLVDPHPFWGGWIVAIIASVIFVSFATWIVVQRIREGKHGEND